MTLMSKLHFLIPKNGFHSERLKLHGEPIDLLPHVLLRKYIAYARKYVPSPRLSSAAAKVLQHFYLELRRQHQTMDATPVTTRQLESLIRLTQVEYITLISEETLPSIVGPPTPDIVQKWNDFFYYQ